MDKQNKYGSWLKVWSSANEVQKRQIAAVKALELGWGGITTVETLTGMSHTTIRKGIQELQNVDEIKRKRIRRIGGGRKKIEIKDQKVIEDLEKIMDKNTAGDPMSLLKWTNKSTYKISEELKELGYDICPNTVGRLLKEQDYSLQANVKTIEGSSSPERDEQFKYINKARRLRSRSAPLRGAPILFENGYIWPYLLLVQTVVHFVRNCPSGAPTS